MAGIATKENELEQMKVQIADLEDEVWNIETKGGDISIQQTQIEDLRVQMKDKKLEIAGEYERKDDLEGILQENEENAPDPALRQFYLDEIVYPILDSLKSIDSYGLRVTSEKDILKSRDAIRDKGKSKAVEFDQQFAIRMDKKASMIAGENVMGYIEGTDKKDELVIISAHYDHLGKRGNDIYNGADDNGSGTSTVLDIAEAFVQAKEEGYGPRRSVLCLLVTGEEKGLLGSEYYSKSPVFPLDKTVANVNVDMIGRVDPAHEGNSNYNYVIGSDRLSSDLHRINETVNHALPIFFFFVLFFFFFFFLRLIVLLLRLFLLLSLPP